MKAMGRLAPSPTGRLHLGNAFAFLAAWLSARSQGGGLALRMEDIDPERSRPEFASAILEDLRWLGLDWDEGPDRGGPHAPYEQSGRLERYAAALADLAGRGLAYACYCTRKELRSLASAPHVGDEGAPYPGTCRNLDPARRAALEKTGRRACLRLDTAKALATATAPCLEGATAPCQEGATAPCLEGATAPCQEGATAPCQEGATAPCQEGATAPCRKSPFGKDSVAFTDAVLGAQTVSLAACGGDFALRRSDGVVAYQLAVTVDDADMGVTEVVRGDDLLLSTPRQLLLFTLMGRAAPRYAHVPLVHDARGERLAKRHKSLELAALRAAGVRPEALVGWLAHLAGWRERPGRARPGELLAAFSFHSLRRARLIVPENIVDLLLRL